MWPTQNSGLENLLAPTNFEFFAYFVCKMERQLKINSVYKDKNPIKVNMKILAGYTARQLRRKQTKTNR